MGHITVPVVSRMTTPDSAATAPVSFRRSNLEARHALLFWLIALMWTTLQTPRETQVDPQSTIVGMPGWVFYAVVLPWVLFALCTAAYALFWMTDDPDTTASLTP
jgi:hypothetical protein